MLFVGLDVQTSRACSWAALDGDYTVRGSGWLKGTTRGEIASSLASLLDSLGSSEPVVVGIDAPRLPLPRPRVLNFSKTKGWLPCSPRRGRHCELVLMNLGLANPQWTPLEEAAPEWMRLGFGLFEAAGAHDALEIFPTASYGMLAEADTPTIRISFRNFARGPKDMLDAHIAAVTAAEFVAGRGCEIGGGDGLGTIVLPRPCTVKQLGLHTWPTLASTAGAS